MNRGRRDGGREGKDEKKGGNEEARLEEKKEKGSDRCQYLCTITLASPKRLSQSSLKKSEKKGKKGFGCLNTL